MEDVFINLRKKSPSRVSCRIGNHATILRKGDWLIQTPIGWKTINSYDEIEKVLSFDILTHLFIFDGIEKIEGKEFFCGTLFNPMRTEDHFVRLPLVQTKSKKHSPPQKNTFSTKIKPQTSQDMENHPDEKSKRIEE